MHLYKEKSLEPLFEYDTIILNDIVSKSNFCKVYIPILKAEFKEI